jgi:hypothetical protein
MDRTVKFLLFVIAASLVMLNLQLAGVGFVKEAHANVRALDLIDIENGLMGISTAISGIDCSR